MKSFKNIFLISSSNRWRRKSGKKAGNQAHRGDGAHPSFRKPGTRKMKSRKSGEYLRVGSRLPHGLHNQAVRGCGKWLPRVQSAVKCRPDARGEEPGFAHSIHTGAFRQNCSHSGLDSFRITLGCSHPEFLMAVVGEGKPGDAAVRALLKCDARTAAAGIKKAIGKLRQKLRLVAGTVARH
jgi:hypothetical protein